MVVQPTYDGPVARAGTGQVPRHHSRLDSGEYRVEIVVGLQMMHLYAPTFAKLDDLGDGALGGRDY
jgi:hypothetical protein